MAVKTNFFGKTGGVREFRLGYICLHEIARVTYWLMAIRSMGGVHFSNTTFWWVAFRQALCKGVHRR